MVIYRVTNKLNGKSYVGQTIQSLLRRQSRHLSDVRNGDESYFHRALRKCGTDNFIWQVICICPNINSLNEQEQYYIALFNLTNSKHGYNLTSGGLNYIISDETRKKMSELQRGKVTSEITKKKMSKARQGIQFTDEHRENIRQSRIGQKMSEVAKSKISKSLTGRPVSQKTRKKLSESNKKYSGEETSFYGRHHTEETKQKMRDNHVGMTGRHVSKATKAKLSKAIAGKKHYLYGKHLSEETKKKISESRKRTNAKLIKLK